MALEFPDGFKMLNPTPIEAKMKVTSLSTLTDNPTLFIGFAPIWDDTTQAFYGVSGGSTGSWSFRKLGTELSFSWKEDNVAIRAIIEHDTGHNIADTSTGKIYEYDETLSDADDGDIYLKPDNVIGNGRFKKIFTIATKASVDTAQGDIDTHTNGGAGKHDASEIGRGGSDVNADLTAVEGNIATLQNKTQKQDSSGDFTLSPVIPSPTLTTHAAQKAQVDTAQSTASTAQSIASTNTTNIGTNTTNIGTNASDIIELQNKPLYFPFEEDTYGNFHEFVHDIRLVKGFNPNETYYVSSISGTDNTHITGLIINNSQNTTVFNWSGSATFTDGNSFAKWAFLTVGNFTVNIYIDDSTLSGSWSHAGEHADIVRECSSAWVQEIEIVNSKTQVRTIDLSSGSDIDLDIGEDFEKSCGTDQAFTISNVELKKPFRLILTGGSLNTTLFTSYTANWIYEDDISSYDNGIINYLWCEIRSVGQIYIFWGE